MPYVYLGAVASTSCSLIGDLHLQKLLDSERVVQGSYLNIGTYVLVGA